MVDGGRAIFGRESFQVRARPGQEMVLVMRSADTVSAAVYRSGGSRSYDLTIAEAGFELSVNGQPATRIAFSPRPGWDEIVLRLPAAMLQGDTARFEIKGRYASFHYWFFQ